LVNEPTPIRIKSADQWWVRVSGQTYGPYSMERLARFVHEGRIQADTQVTDKQNGAWVEARRVIGLIGRSDKPANDSAAEAANIFVHAEIVSGAWIAFMAALESMGTVCEMAPGLWLLRTRFSVGVIRNSLSQTLERGDRFVVVDATRDRLAWFNLGMEADAKISKVWNGPLRADIAGG
jgi:GYF domain 2